jgi:mevalonate kinase
LGYWVIFNMSIIVSAPGKIHLLGEHAVLYGKPAVLCAIDRRVYVTTKNLESCGVGFRSARPRTKNKKEILIESDYGEDLIKQAIEVFKNAFRIEKIPPIAIKITSQIPVGSGLGSSAAVAAAIIGALMKSVKNIWNPIRINELAYETEKYAHGNPSGADNTTVVFGGLVWFRREFDFLKSIWHLPVTSYKFPKIILVDTGKPQESTKEMVHLVAESVKKRRKKMETVFNNQEIQTKKLLMSLRNNDFKSFLESVVQGERNLEQMGVVSNITKNIIREIEKTGGCAKVCGAGGRKKNSGILLAYHEDLSVFRKILDKYKLKNYPVVLGGEGLRMEKNNPIIPASPASRQ